MMVTMFFWHVYKNCEGKVCKNVGWITVLYRIFWVDFFLYTFKCTLFCLWSCGFFWMNIMTELDAFFAGVIFVVEKWNGYDISYFLCIIWQRQRKVESRVKKWLGDYFVFSTIMLVDWYVETLSIWHSYGFREFNFLKKNWKWIAG